MGASDEGGVSMLYIDAVFLDKPAMLITLTDPRALRVCIVGRMNCGAPQLLEEIQCVDFRLRRAMRPAADRTYALTNEEDSHQL